MFYAIHQDMQCSAIVNVKCMLYAIMNNNGVNSTTTKLKLVGVVMYQKTKHIYTDISVP